MTPKMRDHAHAKLEKAVGGPVMLMSGVSREGVTDVLRALRARIDAGRLRERQGAVEATPWQP